MKHLTAFLTAVGAAAVLCAQSPGVRELELPHPPDSMTEPRDRADFLVAHFWDNLDTADTTLTHSPEFIESNFATYATIFPICNLDSVLPPAATALLAKAHGDSQFFSLLVNTADKYLYDPYSPVANEAAYAVFLEAILADSCLDPTVRPRFEMQRADIAKNAPGTPATDFDITLRSGGETTLHALLGGAPRTLLLFYDPDCHDCSVLIEEMQASPETQAALADKRLQIVAVYPDGDEDMFAAGVGKIPAGWTDGMNTGGAIFEQELYNIRHTPSVYLLAPDATVLARDIPLADILQML